MQQTRLQLFMHEIFCQKVRIPRIPNYLMKIDQRNFHDIQKRRQFLAKYSNRKWSSELSDDDVGNKYLVNQSISESLNASSGQMLWQQKLYLAPDRN